MPGKRWTAAEAAEAQRQLRSGKMPDEVTIPGRSAEAVRRKLARRKLIGDGVSRKVWPAEQRQTLQDYVAASWTARDFLYARSMGKDLLPGRSLNAIQKQMQRMKLGDPVVAKRARQSVRFTEAQKTLFCAFLRQHYTTRTPEELAKLWNRAHSPKVKVGRVRSYLEREGIKLPRSEIVAMLYSRTKRSAGTRTKDCVVARGTRSLLYWERRERAMLAKADDVRMRAAESGRRLVEWTCQSRFPDSRFPGCGRPFPAQRPFFSLRPKDDGTRTRAGRRMCTLCVAKKRRSKRYPTANQRCG